MEIELFGYKIRLELILISLVIVWVIWGNTLCSCSKISLEEGFDLLNSVSVTSDESSLTFKIDHKSEPESHMGSKAKLAELDDAQDNRNFFESTSFTPECCPQAYSNSDGCACLDNKQTNYLNLRGGNRDNTANYIV